MNGLVYHIISGQSFFSGITLLLVAAYLSVWRKPVLSRISVLAFLTGSIAITVSSTPIPLWTYVITGVTTFIWISTWMMKRWQVCAASSVSVAWILAGIIELPCHITPSLNAASSARLTVIGDSVTAGIGGDEKSETWPRILGRERCLTIQDFSHVGETAASALKRIKSHSIDAPIIIIEIGGNDLLGSTSSADFEKNLDMLLMVLSKPGCQIVMFELPLPPFCHHYGYVQRQVAARHHVLLIPKRIFLSVIAGTNSTLDSIHLSQAGHQKMADCVWAVVKSAFTPR